jgi:hypothetical protein
MKSISLEAPGPLAQFWARRVVGARKLRAEARDVPAGMQREVLAALEETARDPVGFGDCFVFGRCTAEHELALAAALEQLGHGDARTFWCVDGAQRARTSGATLSASGAHYVLLDTVEFDARGLAVLRQKHQVRSVSAVMVADDFPWSLGRVVQGLAGLLAARASLLVAGRQAALLESFWFDELRRGHLGFEVSRTGAPASAWASFRLHRRHQV